MLKSGSRTVLSREQARVWLNERRGRRIDARLEIDGGGDDSPLLQVSGDLTNLLDDMWDYVAGESKSFAESVLDVSSSTQPAALPPDHRLLGPAYELGDHADLDLTSLRACRHRESHHPRTELPPSYARTAHSTQREPASASDRGAASTASLADVPRCLI